MTGEHRSTGAVGRGVTVALFLSGVFLVLVALTPPLVAAAVALAAAGAVGAVRARAVPKATAHCLLQATLDPTVQVDAPRASASTVVISHPGAPSAA